jgi:hypothetical protein
MSWEAFKQAARLQEPRQVPVGLIVDSPWLPGYAGIDTRDYFLLPDRWLEINLGLLERFPDAVWLPGFWVEYGMAAEPSGFGVKLHFHNNRPPSIEPLVSDLSCRWCCACTSGQRSVYAPMGWVSAWSARAAPWLSPRR